MEAVRLVHTFNFFHVGKPVKLLISLFTDPFSAVCETIVLVDVISPGRINVILLPVRTALNSFEDLIFNKI